MPPIRTKTKSTKTGNVRKDAIEKPIFFSKPQFKDGYLSQFTISEFTHEDEEYKTAEMWMMVQKARLFKDEVTAQKMLKQSNPKKHRALGRKIKNFDPKLWDKHKYQIVVEGNRHKFTKAANAVELREKLLETGDRPIVEAASWDRVWGIGYGKGSAIKNRANWGENLLGKALEDVRAELAATA